MQNHRLGAIWGLTGVALLLSSAVYRLGLVAVDASAHYPLLAGRWLGPLLLALLLGLLKGRFVFQRGFAPRIAARARALRHHDHRLHQLLAPLFCMTYFHTGKKRQRVSIGVSSGVVLLIILVRQLEQPLRGIIDLGVAVGLAWGVAAILYYGYQALTAAEFPYSPELPAERELPAGRE
jgi:hypothetical protein